VRVRVTGEVIEDGRILVLNRDTDTARSRSLPGGKVEDGETLAVAPVREMPEDGFRSEIAPICLSAMHRSSFQLC
jgi:ADP-ribose pyrophosphatase YjhB (NUDIX family)